MAAASNPLRSDFCTFFSERTTAGVSSLSFSLSLHCFYAQGSVAYRLSGAELDSAMRTLPKSKTCEVYCVSGNGHSGCAATQVRHGCALLVRKRRCQTEPATRTSIFPVFLSSSACSFDVGYLCTSPERMRDNQPQFILIVKSVSRDMRVSLS